MKGSGRNISLTSYDDLFSTEKTRQADAREQVLQIPLSELHPFKDHPFRVVDDDRMMETVESVKEYGVLVPAIARPLKMAGMRSSPDTGESVLRTGRPLHHAGHRPRPR